MAEYNSYGTLLYVGLDNASPETMSVVGQIQDVGGVNVTAAEIDTTVHNGAGWTTRMPGIMSAGNVSLKVIFDPATPTLLHDGGTNAMWGLLTATSSTTAERVRFWEIRLAGTSKKFRFEGFVSSFQSQSPLQGTHTADITITPTGTVSLV
jgi:hypothetical protein